MHCEEARLCCQEQLDGEPQSVDLARHLQSCPDCRVYADRMARVHEMLAGSAEAEWRPELTAGVLGRIRAERKQSRWRFLAAAAMVMFCAWLGTLLLPEVPAIANADRVVSEKLPLPESPDAALSSLQGSLEALARGAGDLLGASPGISGIPLAILCLLLILALDGLLFSRSLLTRGRKS